MKYWGYFAGKLLAGAGVVWLAWLALNRLMPNPEMIFGYRLRRLGQDFSWTIAILLLSLAAAGLLWLAVLDQQRRCRVCVRRLRMPVTRGLWSEASLFSPPATESICPYGHGTLTEHDVHVAGVDAPEWKRHDDDIWRELESHEGSKR